MTSGVWWRWKAEEEEGWAATYAKATVERAGLTPDSTRQLAKEQETQIQIQGEYLYQTPVNTYHLER